MKLMSEWCLDMMQKCEPRDIGTYAEMYRHWFKWELTDKKPSEDKVKSLLVE